MKIKTILLTVFSLLVFINGIAAQEKNTQKKVSKKNIPKLENKFPDPKRPGAVKVNPDSLKGFMDKNTNGIDDRLEFSKRKQQKSGKRDKFIDLNGDGICDGRESALGLKKMLRNRKGRGGKK